MAEKGELVCEESVSPSPAATPRQSMTEVESSKHTGGSSPARSSSSEQNQEVKVKAEQPEAKADTKGSNTPHPHPYPLVQLPTIFLSV